MADCPPYYPTNPSEATTSLELFPILPADCPTIPSGPSTVQVLNCGLSAPKWRTVRRTLLPTHQRQQRLWNNFQFYLRTVRPPLADRPQFTYSIHQRRQRLWTKPQTLLRTVRAQVADRPQLNPANSHQRHRLWTDFRFQRRTVRSPIADCPQATLLNYQRQHRLWTKPNLTGGLSAPPRRTVRDT